MKLTPRQLDVCQFIWRYRHKHGYSPTLREIGSAMGATSAATIHEHMEKLAAKGAITSAANQGSRDYFLNLTAEQLCIERPNLKLPVLGEVDASEMIAWRKKWAMTYLPHRH